MIKLWPFPSTPVQQGALTPAKRIHELDGIRGLSALLIAITHFQTFFTSTPFIPGGALCVDIFFILSGIVLSYSYEQKIWGGGKGIREFWVHRFARLYPLHLFSLGLILALMALFKFILGVNPGLIRCPSLNGETSSVFFSGFMNLLLLQSAGFGADYAWDSPSWSISVEVVVNVLWVWLLTRTRSSIPMLFLVFLSFYINLVAGGYTIRPYSENAFGLINFGVLRGVMGFMLGVLCYRHIVPHLQLLSKGMVNTLALVATVVTAIVFHLGTGPEVEGSFYIMALFVLPIFILSAIHADCFLHVFFSLPPLLWLGKISYSLYLMHWIVGDIIEFYQESFFHNDRALIIPVYLGALFILSSLAYYLIEAPCRQLISRRWK